MPDLIIYRVCHLERKVFNYQTTILLNIIKGRSDFQCDRR